MSEIGESCNFVLLYLLTTGLCTLLVPRVCKFEWVFELCVCNEHCLAFCKCTNYIEALRMSPGRQGLLANKLDGTSVNFLQITAEPVIPS